MRTLLCAILVALTAAVAYPRRYVKPGGKVALVQHAEAVKAADTVSADTSKIHVAGFEKTLASTRETMMVTNGLGRPVTGLEVRIVYRDMAGRMLHTASHSVGVHIPVGETRMITVPSFDRQKAFYYHLSPAPVRVRTATPFQVQATVTTVIHPIEQ